VETEGLIKYFIVQAIGSRVFLMGVVRSSRIITLARFLLKLGMFPFFFWVPLVIGSITWFGCFFVRTFQKLPRMLSLFSPLFFHERGRDVLIIFSASLSIIRGRIIGLNQRDIRSLIAYSSVSQRSHLAICLYIRFTLFVIYAAVYFLISGITFYIFDRSRFLNLKDVRGEERSKINLLVLCLMGIPPLPIFYVKIFMLILLLGRPLGVVVSIIILARNIISSFFYLYLVVRRRAKSTTKLIIKENSRIILLLFLVSLYILIYTLTL